MKVLAVDTSGMTASVALAEDEKTIAQFSMNHKRTHSEQLLPMIDHMLKTALWDMAEIDLFAVAKGPGSFTGLRIGITTVKALAHANGKPVVPVSTLDGLAENSFTQGMPIRVCPILDARRSQVYCAVYERGEKIWDDCAVSLEQLLEFLDGGKTLFLGDGVDVYREAIQKAMGENALFQPEQFRYQNAASLAKAGLKAFRNGASQPYYQVEPSYLRVSQAERERAEKTRGETRK